MDSRIICPVLWPLWPTWTVLPLALLSDNIGEDNTGNGNSVLMLIVYVLTCTFHTNVNYEIVSQE